ncbi:MAG: RNA methyltransferase [Chloroflexi bacterium]|nr:RNA methyltransferase [Chloroflexota bacterium]
MEITSRTNPRLRSAARLRDRGARSETGMTLVDGAREVNRAFEAGVAFEALFVCSELLSGPDARAALEAARVTRVEIVACSKDAFGVVAFGDRAEGLVGVVRTTTLEVDDLELPEEPLILVTEGVEKPGNLGAILRSADGAGADALIAVGGTDLDNPNVIRASLGTVFGLPVVAADGEETAAWLLAKGIRVVAAVVGAPLPYFEADLRGSVAIVLGSENAGLSDAWRGSNVEAVSLPMLGVADSLNVSAAAAVLLYEARRQRGG